MGKKFKFFLESPKQLNERNRAFEMSDEMLLLITILN